MELTEKQERYIVRYVHAVSEAIAEKLSGKQCDRALARLRARVENQLENLGKPAIEDVDVITVLRGMGAPERQAMILIRVWGGGKENETEGTENKQTIPAMRGHTSVTVSEEEVAAHVEKDVERREDAREPTTCKKKKQTSDNLVWLGVCAYFGKTLDLPVWVLRVLTILLGIAAAPAIIIMYLGIYFWLRATGRVSSVQPVRIARMVLRPISVVVSIIGIYFVGRYAIKAIIAGCELWFKKTTPEISDWAWLERTDTKMLLLTLLFLVPLSLLSATPMSNGWDYSLKRLTQACIALYAIVTSFGIASYVSGVIIVFVKEFTG